MNNRYVFIDRDGVINKDPGGCTEHGYVSCWGEFEFLPGVLEAMKDLTEAGYGCVIISNQQGVGKGLFTREALDEITDSMSVAIEDAGGNVEGVYYCTHLETENCECRKPKHGLFQSAQNELDIPDISGAYFIGDTERDMIAGKNAGLKTILVLSGKSSREDAEKWENVPTHICDGLKEAADYMIEGDQ